MSIKGISEIRRLPRLGKIHLGVKKTSSRGMEYPTAVDYFVCPPEVQACYGEKPKELDVMFVTPDWNECFPQYYKMYGKGTGLVCKGDGETAGCINKESGEIQEISCPGEECENFISGKCKHIGMLRVMLYKINCGGIYQIDTSSFNSIINLNSSVEMARNLLGQFHGITMKLHIVPREVQVDGKKKTVHVLELRLPSLPLDQLMRIKIIGGGRPMAALPAPDHNEVPEDLFPDVVDQITEEPLPPPSTSPAPTPKNGKSLIWKKTMAEILDIIGRLKIPAEKVSETISLLTDNKKHSSNELDDQEIADLLRWTKMQSMTMKEDLPLDGPQDAAFLKEAGMEV